MSFVRRCGKRFSSVPCRSGWMRRKPLFPPPDDPTTGKRLANKGLQSHKVLTINGKIKIVRRWWHGPQIGSIAPADAILDRDGTTITPGVLEMACRVNLSATSFVQAAAALERTAQVKLSGERLRQVVEATGRRVLKAQQDDAIAVTWHAEDCVVPDSETSKTTRVYTGCDGVMVPFVTDAEKVKRREKVKAKRRLHGRSASRCHRAIAGRTCPGKSSRSPSSTAKTRSVSTWPSRMAITSRQESCCVAKRTRLRFQEADQNVGLVDGAVWIRKQMHLHLPSWTPWAWTSTT